MTAETASAPADRSRADRYLVGALGVCGGIGAFTLQDALVKYISGGYPVHEILVVRCLATLPLLALLVLWESGPRAFVVRRTGWMTVRGIILFGAYLTNSLAIATISLADAAALYFTLPLFVAGLAGPVLGERVPLYRWLAIAVGFGGVLVMVDPGKGVFEPAALLALAAAFLYGLGQMLARKLREESTAAIGFYQTLIYLLCAALLAAFLWDGGFAGSSHKSMEFLVRPWAVPTIPDLLIMLSFAIIGVIGLPLYVTGYKSAPANFVAAFEYTGMLWSVLLGWLLFADLPGRMTLLGALIVVGAGLFMLWFDSRARR